MFDNFRTREKNPDERIGIHQTHEITYWTNQLNCTPEKLKRAVAEVGPMVKPVRKWLSENK
jgi:hypothetical protein